MLGVDQVVLQGVLGEGSGLQSGLTGGVPTQVLLHPRILLLMGTHTTLHAPYPPPMYVRALILLLMGMWQVGGQGQG